MAAELPTSTKGAEPWSASEDRELMQLRKRRGTWLEISRLLGRSDVACQKRYETLSAEEAWRAEGAPLRSRLRA